MGFFRKKLIFDFGTANTVVCSDGKVVYDNLTLFRVWSDNGLNDRYFFPVSGGYVEDRDAFEKYVKSVIRKLTLFPRLSSVLIAVPDEVSGAETSVVQDFMLPFKKLHVKDIRTVPQSVAACAGLGLAADKYHLLLDIGEGKTRISLVKDSRVVKTKVWTDLSAYTWISDIRSHMKSNRDFNCGDATALKALIDVGAATEKISDPPSPVKLTGLSLIMERPHSLEFDHEELAGVLNPCMESMEVSLQKFIEEELATMSEAVMKDITSEGLWLIGGGSRLRGLAGRLQNRISLPVNTLDYPFHLIAKGASLL